MSLFDDISKNELWKQYGFTILRAAALLLAGHLVTSAQYVCNNYVNVADPKTKIGGGILALGALVWGLRNKKRTNTKIDTGLSLPQNTSREVLEQKVGAKG